MCGLIVLAVGLVLAPGALASTGVRHAALGSRHAAAPARTAARALGDGVTTYSITGNVLDYGGNPVAGAEVDWGWWDNGAYTLGNSNVTPSTPDGTDNTGFFQFNPVTTAPTPGNDDLDVFYNPTSPGLWEMRSWSLNFSTNNDSTSYRYEMQPGEVNVSVAHAPSPAIEVKAGLMSVGYANSDVDLTAATPVAGVLPPGFDDVVAYYVGPLQNCTAQTESLGTSQVSVAAGTTAADPVNLDWNNAQYAYLAGATCQHSGGPGTKVKMVLKDWPATRQAEFVAYYGANSSYSYNGSDPMTSSGLGVQTASLKIRPTAPVGMYEIDTYRVDASDSFVQLWDYFQVCTFKSSASVIHHGRAVRLSGKVPGTGKVIIYARTKAAGQPSTTAAKGWAKAGTYTIRSGKFVTGLLHPKRSTWYVARYRGYDFTAFTSVIKVRVH